LPGSRRGSPGRETLKWVRFFLRRERPEYCAGSVNRLRRFKICAHASHDSASQKGVRVLQFLLNKLEVSILHYFGTGPTL
jgi:hypothetical protein